MNAKKLHVKQICKLINMFGSYMLTSYSVCAYICYLYSGNMFSMYCLCPLLSNIPRRCTISIRANMSAAEQPTKRPEMDFVLSYFVIN